MVARAFDPRRLDVAAFAREGAALDGVWPLPALSRVAGGASPDAPPADADEVAWSARGESRPVRGGPPETWLHLRARTSIALVCQRCLAPVAVDLDVDRRFLFVAGEDAAAELDEASEDDVLALTPALDLQALVEDELLLAMPIVPRHEACPEPLAAPADAADDAPAEHPFAALAALKRDARLN